MRMIRTLLVISLMWLSAAPAFAVDCSGTIQTGGSPQVIFTRVVRNVLLMNNSGALMCVAFNGLTASIAGTNCAPGSWVLQPGSGTVSGGSFSNPANMGINQVSIVSANTGDRFSCDQQ